MMRFMVVCLLGAVVAGCGSLTSSTSTPTNTPVSDEEFRIAAERAAEISLLTLTDFPKDWTAELGDTADDEDGFEGLIGSNGTSAACAVAATQEAEADAGKWVARATSDEFSGEHVEQINTEVDVYRREVELSAVIVAVERLFRDCRADIQSVLRNEFDQDSLADPTSPKLTTLHCFELKLLEFGDWAADWRCDFAFDDRALFGDLAIHVTWIQVGRMAGALSYLDTGDLPPQRVDVLRQLFTDRLTWADATLPE